MLSESGRSIDAFQFRCLAAALLLALILPRVAQRGMFLDGITYAVVARNMAVGAGTFWQPSFSNTIYATFFEQPPLGLGLQGLAFRVLGDHLFVERLFSVSVFASTALLIVAIWRRLLPRTYDWLPLFFWVLPSVVTWAAINNMLENTQALFTTLSVFCLVCAAAASSLRVSVVWIGGAAAALIAAFLTKGPVGLFPLAVPPLLLLVPSDQRPTLKKIAWMSLMLLAAVFAAGATLVAFDASRYSIGEFTRTHLMPALEGQRGLPRRSWDIARHLTLGIWARMAGGVVLLWAIRRAGSSKRRFAQTGAFFFATGLAASLPVLMSPVLAGHYFVPSVPFFALAAAALSLPVVQTLKGSTGRRRFVPIGIAVALAMTSVVVLAVHGPMERRDLDLIAGLDAIRPLAPVGSTIGTCENATQEFGFQSYMQRFFRISLETTGAPRGGWFLILKASCAAPPSCEKAAGDPTLLLYRCGASP